jgi:hypothetical protein
MTWSWIMRNRLLWLCVALLIVQAGVPVLVSAAGERQEASVFLDPSFERVGGDSTKARLAIKYDGTGVAVGLRGFHVTIDFDDVYVFIHDTEVDVIEGGFLSSFGPTAFFTELEDQNTVVVDGSILGATPGATGAGELFTLVYTARPTGDGVSPVEFVEVTLRDPDNGPIAYVTTDASIELDNTPPDVPFMVGEPPYTAGTTNTVYWSDQSASGAVGYCAEAAENPDFDPIYMSSGCTPLLQATFGPLTDGQIYYYRVKCRDDVWNVSDWSDTRFSTQDDSPPESEAGPLDPYYNTYAVTIPVTGFDATSGISSIRLFYQVDGGGYQQYNGTFPVAPILFQAVVEGDYDFYTLARDVVGNVEAPPSSPDCSTVIDITDPTPVVDFEALPGHNKIHLSWTTPVGRDAPIEGTVIVRKPWGLMAYPEYDDVSPPLGYPAHPTDGTVVAFVPGTGAQTYGDESFDDSSRNVYYYTAFARDAAGNHSAAAASAQDRSTSYWLGDVDDPTGTPGVYDGYVDFYDKLVLSDSYYTQDGDTYYEPEMDVGPTDDESRFGIPLTDNWIDFEDLMIVAMNYGRVDPSGRLGVPARPADVSAGPLRVALTLDGSAFAVGEEIDVGIVLSGGSRPKGVSCLVGYDPARLEFVDVMATGALADLGGQAFVYGQEIASGRFLLDFAALGVDRVIEADGAVASLSFRVLSGEPTDVRLVELTVRGPANEKIECEREDLSLGGDGAASWAYRLEQNTPNPFNPCTTVGFAIPRSEHVTLAVYAPSGRLVRTLIDGVCEAGRRSVTWDGTSSDGAEAASGVYLCVLEARGARLTRKMVLMK